MSRELSLAEIFQLGYYWETKILLSAVKLDVFSTLDRTAQTARDIASRIGADEAAQFCLVHGLSHADAGLVAWLVQNHLLMSLTAQKQDISDARVVGEFAHKVGDRTRLDYLFLLTCADIRGTNPALWNSWRESLLKELYRQSIRILEGGVDPSSLDQERADETRGRALSLLTARGIDARRRDPGLYHTNVFGNPSARAGWASWRALAMHSPSSAAVVPPCLQRSMNACTSGASAASFCAIG